MPKHFRSPARYSIALWAFVGALLTGCGADGVTMEEELEFIVTLMNGDQVGGLAIDLAYSAESINCLSSCSVAPAGSRNAHISHAAPGNFSFTAIRGGVTLATVSCEAVASTIKEVIWFPDAKGSNSGALLCGTGWVGGQMCPKLRENTAGDGSLLDDCDAPSWKLEPLTSPPLSANHDDQVSFGTTLVSYSFPETIEVGKTYTVSATFTASITYKPGFTGPEKLYFGVGGPGIPLTASKSLDLGSTSLSVRTLTGTITITESWTVPAATNYPGKKYGISMGTGFFSHVWGINWLLMYSPLP